MKSLEEFRQLIDSRKNANEKPIELADLPLADPATPSVHGEDPSKNASSDEFASLGEVEAERLRELRRLGIYTCETLGKLIKQQQRQPYQVEGLLKSKSINLLVG